MLYTGYVFSHGTILIDRSVEDVYAWLASMVNHLKCWDMIHAAQLDENAIDNLETRASYKLSGRTYLCDFKLHLTRPGAGMVTRIQWDNGELAGEWRIFEDGDKCRIELNIEGNGGGLANSVNIIQMNPRILNNVKSAFTLS